MSNGESLPDIDEVVVEVRNLVLPRLGDQWIHDQYIGQTEGGVVGYIQPDHVSPTYRFRYELFPGVAHSNALRIARNLLRDFAAWEDAQAARIRMVGLDDFEGDVGDVSTWLQTAERQGWRLVEIASGGGIGTIAILRAPREIGEVPPL